MTWSPPLARLVKVTLLGGWVARPVGADRIRHAVDGALWPPERCGKTEGQGNAKTPPVGKRGRPGLDTPAFNLERDDLG